MSDRREPYFREVPPVNGAAAMRPEERASLENPSVSLTDPRAWEILWGEARVAGVSVSPETAMRIAAVYSCVRIIAETIASLPFQVFGRTDSGKELAPRHPLYFLIHDRPNPYMTSFQWRETLLTHVLLWGNGYCLIDQTKGGRILGLYPLMPWHVHPERLKTREIVYRVQVEGDEERLEGWQVLHIPGLGFDGIKGLSPIALMRNAVGIGMAAEQFAADFYANDARPGVVIETGVAASQKQGQQIKEEMDRKFTGSGKKWKTMVLGPGLKLHPIQMPLADAQFLETRKFQRNEIHSIYRVPPHMAGDLDKATFSNIEQQDIGFAKHTILPWLRKIEQECNAKLFSDRASSFCEFNLDGLLRGDFLTRTQGYRELVNAGVMKRSEVRRLENLPDAKEVDRFLVQGAMVTVASDGSLEHPKAEPAEAPDEPAEKPEA
jgi:HK97 family phage portal protein